MAAPHTRRVVGRTSRHFQGGACSSRRQADRALDAELALRLSSQCRVSASGGTEVLLVVTRPRTAVTVQPERIHREACRTPPPRSRWHGRAIFELPSDLQPILGEVAEDPVMPTLLSQMQEEAVGGETVARWARRTALLRKGIARVVRDRRAWGSPIRGGQHPCVGGAGRRGHHHRGRHRSRHGGAQAQNACLARMHSSICDTHDRHSLVMVQAPRSPTCSKHHRRSKTRRSRS